LSKKEGWKRSKNKVKGNRKRKERKNGKICSNTLTGKMEASLTRIRSRTGLWNWLNELGVDP
jgi:hypothetical protein